MDTVHCLWLDQGERCLTAPPALPRQRPGAVRCCRPLTVGGTLILLEEFRASRFWSQVAGTARRRRRSSRCSCARSWRGPSDPDERDHQRAGVCHAINVSDARRRSFEDALRRVADQRLRALGGDDAAHGPSRGRPAPLAVGRAARRPAGGSCSSRRGRACGGAGRGGEITVQGTPGRDIMLGYYKDEEATAGAVPRRGACTPATTPTPTRWATCTSSTARRT